jgi:ribose transport system ATP-binding protein
LQDTKEGISILVLDEPTASLPGADVDTLFEAVRRLTKRGISVIFVSHHLEEVFDITDRVTVLRDGKVVGTKATKDLNMDSLIEMIVGRGVTSIAANRTVDSSLAPRLQVQGLVGAGINGVSFSVQPGEVLGVVGLTGSGRDTMVGTLAGALTRQGDVLIDGVELKGGDPRESLTKGLSFVPVDRLRNGILALMSVRSNITISDVERNAHGMRLSHKEEKAEAAEWVKKLSVVTAGTEVPISTLSGGNQQKIMMARSFRLNPKVLLLDEPTQGVDIGAKEEIHAFVDQAAADGTSVVVCSTDTSELARLCDRVVVMYRGQITNTLTRASGLSAEKIDQLLLAGSSMATAS